MKILILTEEQAKSKKYHIRDMFDAALVFTIKENTVEVSKNMISDFRGEFTKGSLINLGNTHSACDINTQQRMNRYEQMLVADYVESNKKANDLNDLMYEYFEDLIKHAITREDAELILKRMPRESVAYVFMLDRIRNIFKDDKNA